MEGREDSGLIDRLPVPVLHLDRELRLLYANAAAERRLDLASLRLTGTTPRPAHAAPPVPEPLMRACRAALAAGAPQRAELSPGGARGLEAHIFPELDAGGRAFGLIAVLLEDSAHARLEAVPPSAAAQRETGRRQDELLSTLAHELRNPLAPIRNALEIMRVAETDRAAVAAARVVVERQLRHLVRLIHDLLDVSRAMQGRLELRRERVELAGVIRLALETSRSLIEGKQHIVRIEPGGEPLHVDADPLRLVQVFANLLDNSAKYSEPHGRITVRLAREDDWAVASVADTGIGIAPELLPRVFDVFAGIDRASMAAQEGLGVGLTLAKRLVELHDGTIEARSEGAGRGSTFIVRLPLARGGGTERAAPAGSIEPAHAPRTGGRVLVADDNHDSAASLALLLSLDGYEVRTAYDGIDALAVARKFRPEVALVDIGMPRLDGYETARRLRAEPWGRSMKLYALTGWGQAEDMQRALAAGFDRHLVKPVDPETLRQLLATDGPAG